MLRIVCLCLLLAGPGWAASSGPDAGGACASASRPQDRFEYREMSAVLRELDALRADSPNLVLDTRILSRDPLPAGTCLALETAPPISIVVGADGVFHFPLDAALEAENPAVTINLADDSWSLQARLKVLASAQRRFDFGVYTDLQKEYQGLLRRQPFWARWMAPEPRGLLLRFAPGQVAEALVVGGESSERYTSDAHGVMRIPALDVYIDSQASVEVSDLPASIELDLPDAD